MNERHSNNHCSALVPLVVPLVTAAALTAFTTAPLAAQHETYSGSGDDVVRLDKPKPDMPALLVVEGNARGRHFAVIGYTAGRERVGSLVNTTEPYQGIVPVDLPPRQNTELLEVSASGSWTIQVYPIGAAQEIDVPGTFEGDGDRVLWVEGEPSTAEISGNRNERHFSVLAYDQYGSRQGSLVNTTNSYDGTVLMPEGVRLLKVSASGSWTIRLAAQETPEAQETTGSGGWEYDAEGGGNAYTSGNGKMLSFSCFSRGLGFMFVPANESALKEMRPIFDADTARVIGQVDGAEPDTLNVESSRPLLTSYGDQGGEVRRLADQVAKGDELTTQIASPSEGQTLLTETFSLDGSSQALNRLSCYP